MAESREKEGGSGLQQPAPLSAEEEQRREAVRLRQLAAASAGLPDEQLEAQCALEFFTAGGPGGQHRNKTESGVRLRHLPTGILAAATERRSQAQNRLTALMRLRAKLHLAAFVPRTRKPTKISRAQKAKRLEQKRQVARRKQERRSSGEE